MEILYWPYFINEIILHELFLSAAGFRKQIKKFKYTITPKHSSFIGNS